jgi:hypothetical protein
MPVCLPGCDSRPGHKNACQLQVWTDVWQNSDQPCNFATLKTIMETTLHHQGNTLHDHGMSTALFCTTTPLETILHSLGKQHHTTVMKAKMGLSCRLKTAISAVGD